MDSHTPIPSIEKRSFWKNCPVTSGLLLIYWPAVVADIFLSPSSIRPYFLKECQFMLGDGELPFLLNSMCQKIDVYSYLYMALGLIIAIALDNNRLNKFLRGEPELSPAPTLIVMFIFFCPLMFTLWSHLLW